ncbi:MAG: hypothetical protein H7Y03_14230 [Chitinophagaceae bacterium]|nr:hypothetical protein [Chitinophagaceae bacterium]
MTNPLTDEQYRKTLAAPMVNVTSTPGPVINIWPYVDQLVAAHVVHPYVYKQQLVEAVYRNPTHKIDHVLLPTQEPNIFNVIVVDLNQNAVIGHYLQDLNKAS